MRKKEIILLSILVILGILGCFFYYISSQNKVEGSYVRITVDGEEEYVLPINIDKTVEISNPYGTNKISIEEKSVYVSYADCPDSICITSGKIKNEGENLICLPHKLVVTIISEEEYEK